MTDINTLIAQAKAAEGIADQTETPAGGDFVYEVPAAGMTPARFVGYVELGERPQRPYQGQEKPPAPEVKLYFELNGPKHQREVEVNGETKKFTNTITQTVAMKLGDKATFKKLFNKMTYGRDGITHMSHMLGEAFLITIVHNEEKNPKEGRKPRTFANMRDKEGVWLIQAPVIDDPLSGESKPVPVPEATAPLKLLLWDAPTKEMWDSIFVDGTRTVKNEKGEEVEVSKNWLQEDIVQNALDFDGSPLQALIGGLGDLTLEAEPESTTTEEDKEPGNVNVGADKDTSAPTTASADTAEPEESKKNTESSSDDVDDLMKSLGLA